MAKTSDRPCIAYQRDPLPLASFLPPLPKESFLMSCITHCKPENRATNSQVLASTCTPVLPFPPLLSLLPLPLRQVAISHYPRLKRLQGVAASASSSLTNNTPTTTRTTTTAQHTGRGTVGRHSSVPVTFLHFSANGAAPSLPPPLAFAARWQQRPKVTSDT